MSDKELLGKKIKVLRDHNGLTQKELADRVHIDTSKVSRIENGESDCGDELLCLIKKELQAADIPLTACEVVAFNEKLSEWSLLIKNKCVDEAEKTRALFVRVEMIPLEAELTHKTIICNAKYYCMRGQFSEAKVCLDKITEADINCNADILYDYYCTLGAYYMFFSQYQAALPYLLKAEKTSSKAVENDEELPYNIGVCYTALCAPYYAVSRLERAQKIADINHKTVHCAYFDIMLALNYNKMGDCDRAEKLLKNCLALAQCSGDRLLVGTVFHDLGAVCLKKQDYSAAIDLFDRAFEYFDEGGRNYLENSLYKIYALLANEDANAANSLLEHSKKMAANFSDILVKFLAVENSQKLNENDALEYITQTAIPHFIAVCELFTALEYCEKVEAFYHKKESNKKASEYTRLQNEIFKKIFYGR